MEENIAHYQPTELQNQPEKHWLKIVGFSVVGLVLAGSLVWAGIQVGKRQARPTPQPVISTPPPATPTFRVVITPTLPPELTPLPDETAEWKSYKSSTEEYSRYTIDYPKDWSFKEELAHGTADLRITFNNSIGKPSIVFVVSFLDFKGSFYASQSEYLGELKEVSIGGRKGYVFDNKYGYLTAYYFPLQEGYFALELLNEAERDVLQKMPLTFKFLD